MKPRPPKILVAEIAPPASLIDPPDNGMSMFRKYASLMAADEVEYGMDAQCMAAAKSEDEQEAECMDRMAAYGSEFAADAIFRRNHAAPNSSTRLMGRMPR